MQPKGTFQATSRTEAQQALETMSNRRRQWGEALIKDRKFLALNQTEFAIELSKSQNISVNQQSVARWESGAAPRKDTYDALCRYLNTVLKDHNYESQVLKADLPPSWAFAAWVSNHTTDTKTERWKNDVYTLMESLSFDEVNQHLIKDLFPTGFSLKGFEDWWESTQLELKVKWYENARQIDLDHRFKSNEEQGSSNLTRHNHLEHLLADLLKKPLNNNLQVALKRGINERVYDYFSNKLVAEVKYLPDNRPPSFAIASHAPEIVALKLAETLAFGQNKTYALFLMHHNAGAHEDFNAKYHSLVADCAALGVHLVLVNSVKAIATFITRCEAANETTK